MDEHFVSDLRRSHRSSVAELHPSLPACCLCHCSVSLDNETGEVDSRGICGDCKFLLMEDLDSPEICRGVNFFARTRYRSPDSVESTFSQQFSRAKSWARFLDDDSDDQSLDEDGAERSALFTSSGTTPTNSRRWSRVISDLGNDGFDYFYEDSVSDASFRRYGAFHSEADTNSFRTNGGDSDVSIDGWMIENSSHSNGESNLDTDTDIDPMNAGHVDWNSADESEGEVGTHWEDGNNIGYLLHSAISRFDDRGSESLPVHGAETERPRRGEAASSSILSRLPCMTIKEDNLNLGCAICKDSFSVGTLVKQLPCFHLYHSCCILRWLSTKNTCPLCRYQLPTDENEQEYMKQIHQLELNDENEVNDHISSAGSSQSSHSTSFKSRLLLVVAGPVIGLVGFSLMLWLGINPSSNRTCRSTNRRGSDKLQILWPFWN